MSHLYRALFSFHPAAIPWIARSNYRRELIASLYMPFALATIEGGIASVIVRIAFEGHVDRVALNFAAGFLSVMPALANISSFAWVRLSHGRDKVRFINHLQTAILILVCLVAMAPPTPPGLVLFVLCVLAARMMWAGIVTIRSTIWSMNYPRNARARVTGKFATVQVLAIALLGFALGSAMDVDERSYRVMFPVGAALAIVAVVMWRGVRVRNHRRLIADELAGDGPDRPSFNPISLLRVLKSDPPFRAYMTSQFLLGTGNITATAVLPIIVRERFDGGYLTGIMLSSSLPMFMMPLSIPIWSRLLDKSHVVHFRAIHSWVFVASLVCLFIGAALTQIVWLYASAILTGIAYGGGALAWNLGHLDFAPPGRASLYMGVHVTLTGVRGFFSAIIAVSLYQSLEHIRAGFGSGVFAFCAASTMVGAIGFVIQSRRLAREHKPAPDRQIEVAPPSRSMP